MSYDSQLANFETFVQLLESQTAYAPNETELKSTALRARADRMRAKNAAAGAARSRPHPAQRRALRGKHRLIRHRRRHQKIHQIRLRHRQPAIRANQGFEIYEAAVI
jgi:plasmid stabilization system protein ParE